MRLVHVISGRRGREGKGDRQGRSGRGGWGSFCGMGVVWGASAVRKRKARGTQVDVQRCASPSLPCTPGEAKQLTVALPLGPSDRL